MPAAPNAQANPAFAVEADIRPKMPWRIVSVKPLPGFRLKVCFTDGLEGEVHMEDLLKSSRAGVFAPLRDERLFEKAYLRWGAVTWPGDLDLAPDAMYDDIKEAGVSVVGPFEE